MVMRAAIVLLALLTVMPAPCLADSFEYDAAGRVHQMTTIDGRVIRYSYDVHGNLRSVKVDRLPRPPKVQALIPNTVRAGVEVDVRLTGDHLENVQVSSIGGLSLTVIEASRRTLGLHVQVPKDVAAGAHEIRVINDDGEAWVAINVLPPLPRIEVYPLPLALSDDGAVSKLAVRLSNADVVDRTIRLTASNPSIVEVLDTTLTIPAGEVEAYGRLRGLSGGLAGLALTSSGLEQTSATVYVTAEFGAVDTTISRSVGVLVGNLSPPVEVPVAASSIPLGLFAGTGIERIEPSALAAGAAATRVVIEGRGLQGVDGVRVEPADGLELSSVEAKAGGSAVSALMTVAPDAARGIRRIILEGAEQPYRPVSPGSDRLAIVDPVPRILSLAPRYLRRGSGPQDVDVRGLHLADARSFRLDPVDGVAFASSWSTNETGTEVGLRIDVASSAATGERVLVVESPAGDSGAQPNASNRLFITDSDPPQVQDLAAAALGVHVGDAVDPGVVDASCFGGVIGVVVGSAVHRATPRQLEIGSAANLTLIGAGLERVDQIRIEPSAGISAGPLTIDPLGDTLQVELDITVDAPDTWRQLRVLAEGVEIPFADPAQSRLLVTKPGPSIDGLTPRSIHVDGPEVRLILVGRNLQGAEAVLASPPLLTTGAPSVSADGRRLEVAAKPAPGADTGPVSIQVATPGGLSSSSASPSNTISLFRKARIPPSPLTAPSVGVVVGDNASSTTESSVLASAALGVSRLGTSVAISQSPPVVVARPVGIAIGPVITAVEVPKLILGTNRSLRLFGQELHDVDGVAAFPGMDLRVASPSVSADGSLLEILLTIPDDAEPNRRKLRLVDGSNAVPFAAPMQAIIDIDDGPPTISSIDPIGATAGELITLVIRGARLDDVYRVFAEPPDGLAFSVLPSPAPDGSDVAVKIHIAADAEPGSRTIRVETPGGVSDETQRAANRFTIY